MSEEELPKAYDPKGVEKALYAFWEEKGMFTADPSSSKPKNAAFRALFHESHSRACSYKASAKDK